MSFDLDAKIEYLEQEFEDPKCTTCGGKTIWAEDAWTCTKCGDEWYSDHGPQFAPPGSENRGRESAVACNRESPPGAAPKDCEGLMVCPRCGKRYPQTLVGRCRGDSNQDKEPQ